MILVPICILLVGCIHNTTEKGNEETMKFGKNITITILDNEFINSTYLQNVLDGVIKKDYPYFDSWDNDELAQLIEYMADNNYIIKPGTYTFNQTWGFDDGEFVINESEKRRIFEFQHP